MKTLRTLFIAVYIFAPLLWANNTRAQFIEIKTNPQEEAPKDNVKTEEDISKLFETDPGNYYPKYLKSLLANKKYKQAEKVVQDQLKQARPMQTPVYIIDLGIVQLAAGKTQKAKEQFEKALKMVNGDDMVTQTIAKKFIETDQLPFAIATYEKASNILMNPLLYAGTLAGLYAKNGQLAKAFDILLATNPGVQANVEYVKTTLLQIVGNDNDKLQQVQKIIIKKINEQPDNIFFVEILTWIYTQKNDWDGALIQIEAIDLRNHDPGRKLLDFARLSCNNKQYDVADKAYTDVIDKGPDKPFYNIAKSEQLSMGLNRLKSDTTKGYNTLADSLMNKYSAFLAENPLYNTAQISSDYAQVAALYAGKVKLALSILQDATSKPGQRRDQVGMLKLQMGDYYLLEGKIWDASLTYSQVDKEFKQDAMGEDARFRNAKLAYYRGDFDWAQRQLLILKSATSELIANDALALSVLITENVEDSLKSPLQRFAFAGLLIAQNKDKEATDLLDSIATAFPKHPLNDDILMEHAKMAEKHHD